MSQWCSQLAHSLMIVECNLNAFCSFSKRIFVRDRGCRLILLIDHRVRLFEGKGMVKVMELKSR